MFFLHVATAVLCFAIPLKSSGKDTVESMIRQLGSRDFREREAASRWLLQRPQTADALQDAVRSPDPEVAQRAASILAHFNREPLRRLHTAIKDGAVDQAIQLMAGWPSGKDEESVWASACELTRTLLERHQKQGGQKVDLRFLNTAEPPFLLSGRRITETVKGDRTTSLFVRSDEVDVRERSAPGDSILVASGSVHIGSRLYRSSAIFARGRVELKDAWHVVVVSYGDVIVHRDVVNALIVARGKVTCTDLLVNSRIISGNSVIYNKTNATNCRITENEANPLDFIRFSKAVPKCMEIPKRIGVAVKPYSSSALIHQDVQ